MVSVYKLTNKLNGKIYIGVHKTKRLDDSYFGSGTQIRLAIKKYGKENFNKEHLHVFEDHESHLAYEKEKEYVNEEFIKREDTYNILEGGYCWPIMYGKDHPRFGKVSPHTEETKNKISITLKERFKNPIMRERLVQSALNKNTSYITQEYRDKIGRVHKGKIVSENTRELIRQSKLGILTGPMKKETKNKISESLMGESHPWQDKINKNPEKIRKTADKHRGMKRSEETCKNISEAKKGKVAHNVGKIWVHDPITDERKYILKTDEIPTGYKLGTGTRKKLNVN